MFVVITFFIAASSSQIIRTMRQTMRLIRLNTRHEKLLQSLSQLLGGVSIQRESFPINFLLSFNCSRFLSCLNPIAIETISSKLNDLRKVSTIAQSINSFKNFCRFQHKIVSATDFWRLLNLLHNFTQICSAFWSLAEKLF